jgi:hypothetical protein
MPKTTDHILRDAQKAMTGVRKITDALTHGESESVAEELSHVKRVVEENIGRSRHPIDTVINPTTAKARKVAPLLEKSKSSPTEGKSRA